MTTAEAIAGMVAALESIRRMTADPMRSMDAGRVIDAQRADEIAEEALAAWRERESLDRTERVRAAVWELVATIDRRGVDSPAVLINRTLDAIDAAIFGKREPERESEPDEQDFADRDKGDR